MNKIGIHALVWAGTWAASDCEYAVESSKEAGYDLIEFLLDGTQNGIGDAPIDGIGFMSHFDSRDLTGIDTLASRLDLFGSFQKKLQATEFDVDSEFIDDQTQADYTRDFLQLMGEFPEDSSTLTDEKLADDLSTFRVAREKRRVIREKRIRKHMDKVSTLPKTSF